MSNPYDKAHELAKVIEEDSSYQLVQKLTAKVMENPEQLNKIDEFRRKQFELQQMQMQGQAIDPAELEKTNKLFEELSAINEVKQLLEAEEHLSVLFTDINRILTGPLEKIYKRD